MIRLSDYIVRYLVDHGIGHVFMVTGGAAMHLNDAFGRESKIKKVFCHHEQSCAMAEENRFELSNKFRRDLIKGERKEVKDALRCPSCLNGADLAIRLWTISIRSEGCNPNNVGSHREIVNVNLDGDVANTIINKKTKSKNPIRKNS